MKLRARTSVVGTLTASFALALVGPAVAANASAEASSAVTGAALVRFPEFAGLTDSRSLPDPLMLQGKLTDVTGKALGGAQVLMAAWPSNDTVAKLPVGGSFSVVPVARTVAGKDGAYQLRSLITPLLMSLTGKDGLDVELDVFHGGRHYVYLTQLRNTATSWLHEFVHGADGQAQELSSKLTNGLDLRFAPEQGEPLGRLSQKTRIPVDRRPGPGVPCLPYEKLESRRALTTLVTAVARDGATVETTYAKGAKTVTSTGVSFDNGVSFSTSGARERTSTVKAEFLSDTSKPGGLVSRAYRTNVEHFVFRRECVAERYGKYRYHYVTSPDALRGGFQNIEDDVYAPVKCLKRNTEDLVGVKAISTDNAKAFTYQRAFKLIPVAGSVFSGAALSGYSEQVNVRFSFPTGQGGWCGSTSQPLAPNQRVQGFMS